MAKGIKLSEKVNRLNSFCSLRFFCVHESGTLWFT